MANPVVQASVTGGAVAAWTTGITVTHGFSLTNGDILYAFCNRSDNLSGPWVSTSGGTWTSLNSHDSALGNDMWTSVLRRVVTNAAGEPSTYTFTGGDPGTLPMSLVVAQIRSGDRVKPEDATTVAATGQSDFTPNNADITTSSPGALVLALHAACCDSTGANGKTGGAPSGFTFLRSAISAGTTAMFSMFTEVSYLANSTQGLQSIGVWTGTPDDATSEWHTYAVAVKPSAHSVPIHIVSMNA